MKRCVSSLVALALATWAYTAAAGPARVPPRNTAPEEPRKPSRASTTDHHEASARKAPLAKSSAKKADAPEDRKKREANKKKKRRDAKKGTDRSQAKKRAADAKTVVHHAHGVDLGGGHAEPTIEKVELRPAASRASATKKGPLERASAKHEPSTPELPPLPSAAPPPAAAKSAAKATKPERKRAVRDEDLAELEELVARIRAGRSADAKTGPTAVANAAATNAPPARLERAKPEPTKPETAKPKGKADKVCAKEPVEIVRGPEVDRFPLTTCDGGVAPHAVERLSISVRPGSASRPTAPIAELAKKKGRDIAEGVRRVDERLPLRLQAIVDRFSKTGAPARISVVSGYRPMSIGSLHSSGRALDFRVEGVKNEDVVAFCKTLVDTGCGYYPNSSFVHLDVRDVGAGHVHWIDASGPGESPRYVTAWPPPAPPAERRGTEALATASAKLDREAIPEPRDEHPSDEPEED
jgi:hypothetical protein